MNKAKVFTLGVSVIFLMMLVSSVRADSLHVPRGLLAKLNLTEAQTLELQDFSKADFRDFLIEHFDTAEFGGFLAERFEGNNGLHPGLFVREQVPGATGNNGKHLGAANNNGKRPGFSVTQFNNGMKFGLVNPRHSSPSVSQNPEPTGMLLLGTGLAAAAAFARRRVRRRKEAGER